MTITELAQQTGRTKSTVSVLAGKLEKAGYLRREADPEDARLLRLRLTQKGEALEEAFAEITDEMHRKIAEELGEKELAVLEALLAKSVQIFNPQPESLYQGPVANA